MCMPVWGPDLVSSLPPTRILTFAKFKFNQMLLFNKPAITQKNPALNGCWWQRAEAHPYTAGWAIHRSMSWWQLTCFLPQCPLLPVTECTQSCNPALENVFSHLVLSGSFTEATICFQVSEWEYQAWLQFWICSSSYGITSTDTQPKLHSKTHLGQCQSSFSSC